MSSVKPKRRRKIPYIGKPLTASEIIASYNLTAEDKAAVARALAEVRTRRSSHRSPKNTPSTAKTARAK
jgi:hypothetical protein